MGRRREIQENQDLPKRWRKRGPSYYYQVPRKESHLWGGRTEYRLGGTIEEAMAEFERKTALAAIENLSDDLTDKAHEIAICGVYILMDDEQVIYVGTSQNIPGRIGTHVAAGKKFNRIATVEVEEAKRLAVAAHYINLYRPPGNIKNDQAGRDEKLSDWE